MGYYGNHMARNIIIWLPRILGILILGFISMFALDVFSEGYSLGQLITALTIHLLPSFALLSALIIAWLFPLWGAGAYTLFAAFTYVFFHTYRLPLSFFLITFPPLLIAFLFALQAWYRRKRVY